MSKKAIQILKKVLKKLEIEVKNYEIQGRVGYAQTFRAAKILIRCEIEKLENPKQFFKAFNRKARLIQKHVVKHIK